MSSRLLINAIYKATLYNDLNLTQADIELQSQNKDKTDKIDRQFLVKMLKRQIFTRHG